MSNDFDLPPPIPHQAYFDVSLLEGGYVTIPENLPIEGGSPEVKHKCPVMSFLLRHSKNGKNVVFDLGIRKDWANSPPRVVKAINAIFNAEVPIDVVESLRRGGLRPTDIDFAVLSHMHWDHVGNPELFPTTQFIVGEKSRIILEDGCSQNDNGPLRENAYFWKDTLPEGRTTYLSDVGWSQIGPFTEAYDFFGDGSLYIIDAPGHLLGHINVLVRTSVEGSWVYLGGDSAHDIRLITGEKEIGHYRDPVTGNMLCMQRDLPAAKETMRRIRIISQNPKVLVLIAHDYLWYNANKDTGVRFPGKIKPKV